MKIKPLPLLAGAIALTVTAIPVAVQAQMRSASPLQRTQMSTIARAKKGGMGWQRLNLTDAQKAQMETIKNNTRAQIEGILTAEQRATLQAAKDAPRGERGQRGWANLNLTEQQKTQMREIKQASQQQMLAVLTPEQRQQMEEMRQNMRSRMQQRNSQ
jgi:periplasmic protein CpxP/Spy